MEILEPKSTELRSHWVVFQFPVAAIVTTTQWLKTETEILQQFWGAEV